MLSTRIGGRTTGTHWRRSMNHSWIVSRGTSSTAGGRTHRTFRRKPTGMLAATALVTAGILMNPLIARAADGPFTIDGVVPDAGSVQLTDLSGNVKELGPINSNTTKIGVIHNATPPMLGLTNPN